MNQPLNSHISWLKLTLAGDGASTEIARVTPAGIDCSAGFSLSASSEGAVTTLALQAEQAVSASKICLELAVPILNYHAVLPPDCGRHYVMMDKSLNIRRGDFNITASMAGLPFMALVNNAASQVLSFGLINVSEQVDCVRNLPLISTRKALVGGDDYLALEFSWDLPDDLTNGYDILLYIDDTHLSWFQALEEFSALIIKREKLAYPQNDGAWDPTWCTWTAFPSDNLSSQRVIANAKLAKSLGIGTIILDDGWFGPGLDSEAVLNIGEYYPDPRKIPDLEGLIKAIQDLGLKVLLWHAPLCIADTCRFYQELKSHLMVHDGVEFVSVNGLAQLCPADPFVREYVSKETERLLAYGADGFKIDLYNCLATEKCNSTDHQHDIEGYMAALEAVMKTQWETIQRIRPDAIVELKQDYGNPRLAQYGTMVRAGDTAYDVDTNIRRCFFNQTYVGCVHNDYLMTSTLSEDAELAVMTMKMLVAGVPTFGVDLEKLSASQNTVIRNWLDFYRENLAMFKERREPLNAEMNLWQGGNSRVAWVAPLWQCRELVLPEADKVFVLNATRFDSFYLKLVSARDVTITQFDYKLDKLGCSELSLADGQRMTVSPGGVTVVETKS